ncbi:class D beta-lactamase [Litoribrevibacter euphylliae]|uniref:Beta-lactamase n=1 Tax=Litoribrevibacter euphylliae TaxID=1834034 RepID=A0ABV7HG98_9GAMM
MKFWVLCFISLFASFSGVQAELVQAKIVQSDTAERPDWAQYFDQFDAKGTIVVMDQRKAEDQTMMFNSTRAAQRLSPASTFKIPHTLFALDAGLVKDEFQVFPWDGVKRGYAPHNQDQTLRSAMRHSALWVYEGFADQLGEQNARTYLEKIRYGNQNPTTAKGTYWVDGKLAISAVEQVNFLERLYRNELPFQLDHQRLLKDIMIVEAGSDWILRAKTGWEGRHGWWVGWVEWPTGPVFFALNIDTPNRMDDLYKRQAIVREVLKSIQALPSE